MEVFFGRWCFEMVGAVCSMRLVVETGVCVCVSKVSVNVGRVCVAA